MFVNRERPRSVRITPSRGDGGVDILDRAAGADGSDEVYQVKRYCEPLTSKQKEEIEKSLDSLRKDPRWANLNVKTWYLVTSWDPTPEAETWLHDLAAARKLTAVWHGLTYTDQLAARYPDIVDFYVHGGRNRIEQTYKSVLALLGVDRGDQSDVPSVIARIQAALPTLDADPHYRYEPRFGEGEFPPLASRADLVMTWVSGHVDGGPWVAVDVIARCAASVQERPITIDGRLVAESGSDFESALRDFVSYGTAFTSPEGAYKGEIHAPGGLGGRLDGARVWVLPANDDLGDNPELHVEILDPKGAVLGAVDLDRTERSEGADGMRVVLQEVHHVFSIEDRYDHTTALKRTLQLGDFIGQPVSVVLPALQFLRSCHDPNVGRVSVRHTAPEKGVTDSNWGFVSADADGKLNELMMMIDALVTIQQHTSVLIRVPAPGATLPADTRRWQVAAQLLRGENVTGIYPEGQCLMVELKTEIEGVEDGPLGINMPFMVQVGDQRIELGQLEVWLADATLVARREQEGRTYYAFTTPDRTYRYHWSSGGGS
jgi:hypothetical protein